MLDLLMMTDNELCAHSSHSLCIDYGGPEGQFNLHGSDCAQGSEDSLHFTSENKKWEWTITTRSFALQCLRAVNILLKRRVMRIQVSSQSENPRKPPKWRVLISCVIRLTTHLLIQKSSSSTRSSCLISELLDKQLKQQLQPHALLCVDKAVL